MPLEIRRATDPCLDAWRGMADFARTDEFPRMGITKQEYEEWGGERIEHLVREMWLLKLRAFRNPRVKGRKREESAE